MPLGIYVAGGACRMSHYRYKVRDKDGLLYAGTMEAVHQEAVADRF